MAESAQKVRIIAPGRVHLGLISLTRDSFRAYGGVGIAVWHSRTVVTAEHNVEEENSAVGLNLEFQEAVLGRLRVSGLSGISLKVIEAPLSHIGLGAKTSVLLACLEAAHLAVGMELNRAALITIAGRGGASGVGVNTYFDGGVIADDGHSARAITDFIPSSQRRLIEDIPGVIYRRRWPQQWQISLLLSRGVVGLHDKSEEEFFRLHTPIERSECSDVAMALLLELPAAIRSNDFDAFRDCIQRSQRGLKAAEMRHHPDVMEIIENLRGNSEVVATMSSTGPTVIIISKNPWAINDKIFPVEKWYLLTGESADCGRVVDYL